METSNNNDNTQNKQQDSKQQACWKVGFSAFLKRKPRGWEARNVINIKWAMNDDLLVHLIPDAG